MGRMFYLTDPAETSFPDMASLPTSYTAQATPFFAGMIVLEWAILLLRGEKLRLSDGLFSVAHGLIMTLMEYVHVLFYYLNHFLRALLSGLLFSSYIYIHQTFCIYALPWDYTATWVCAAIGIDFCYYWVHRAAHGRRGEIYFRFIDIFVSEINLLWAAHQVHHSSEDYNLTTALRQSAFQTFGSWVFVIALLSFI